MENITSLKKQLSIKNKEICELSGSPYLEPEVIKAKRAYKKAVDKARANTALKLSPLFKEEKALEEKIAALENEKKSAIPEKVQNFLRELYRGVDWGSNGWIIKWVSPNEKFIIATRKGHNGWYARGEIKYYPSDHYLFDITKADNANHGSVLKDNCEVFTVEGRLSAETIKQWKEYALKEES